jgi:hypothetical protein
MRLEKRWRQDCTHRPVTDKHAARIPSRVFTARHNSRKYMATVMGLADDANIYGKNASRLPTFRQTWARAWPDLHVRHQPTFVNHKNLLGYGIAVGYYLAITESVLYLRANNVTCDYHLFFEDDAMPFNGTTWPSQAPNHLDAHLDELEAVDGMALFLGGHSFISVNSSAAAIAAARPYGGITPASMGFGAYAMLAKCSSLAFVAERLHAHLSVTTDRTQVFEELLWNAFSALRDQSIGTGAYVSAPLLVDHLNGYSATWNISGKLLSYNAFEGNSIFW